MFYWTSYEIYNVISFAIGVGMAAAAIRGLTANF